MMSGHNNGGKEMLGEENVQGSSEVSKVITDASLLLEWLAVR